MATVHPFDGSVPLASLASLASRAIPGEAFDDRGLLRKVVLDPNFREGGALVAFEGEAPVGLALAIARRVPLENAPDDRERGYLTFLGVLPEARGRGVGSLLLQAAERFLRDDGRECVLVSPYAPNYFAPGVDVEGCADGLAFLLRRGYSEVYRPLAMEASLWNPVVPEWVARLDREPDGTRYEPFHPDLALRILRFVQAEFPGDWVRVVREVALRIADGDRPSRLWCALADDEVVGFAHWEGERFGPIGVSAKHRGRGIGQILTLRVLRSQREAGFRRAWFLWSDDRTAARLYEGFGFVATRRFAMLRKNLADQG